MKHPIEELKGKEVIVVAQGTEYRGILVEVGVDDITISTPTRWVSIPQSKISKIVPADQPIEVKNPHQISSDFWSDKYDPEK